MSAGAVSQIELGPRHIEGLWPPVKRGATMALTHNMSDGSVWNAARREHLILLEKPAV